MNYGCFFQNSCKKCRPRCYTKPQYCTKYRPNVGETIQMLHLISLNKYVVTLIINQGNSCLTYFMIVSLFLAVVLQELSAISGPKCKHIIPLLEKILLLVRYCGSGHGPENSSSCYMKKFVVSSIIRTICSVYNSCRPNSFSLFVLFHLFQ